MKYVARLIAVSLFLLNGPRARADGKIVVAYVPNWVDLKAFTPTIGFAKVTHVNIAFENPKNADGELSFHRDDDVLIEAARARGVKVLVSIGGGSASGDKAMRTRYFDLLADAKRPAFVKRLAEYVAVHKFDGLDVDLEGPSINKDYGKFIEDLAAALKPGGKLLTAALSQGYGGRQVPDSVFAHLDFVHVMAYDGAGYWEPKSPGQHSSMEYAKSNIAYWLKRGLPKSKTVLGVPFYGYGFGEAFKKRDYPYASIVAEHPGAENADQAGNTIWYNGIPTIKAKTAFALEEGLAGVMIWSLDSDAKGDLSLLNAIDGVIRVGAATPAETKRP